MALADGKIDTMPTGIATGVLGVDSNGRPVLATAMTVQATAPDNGVQFGLVPGNGATIAVGLVRSPTTTTKTALDIMPNGNPSNAAGYGKAWLDVCLQDISAGPATVQCTHIGARTDYAEISMRAFTLAGNDSGTMLPIVLGVGRDTDVEHGLRINTNGRIQLFGTGNEAANGAVATTLGSVGPTTTTAGNPTKWLRMRDSAGTNYVIPMWTIAS